jgi:sulfide:quinone oxidoreductase
MLSGMARTTSARQWGFKALIVGGGVAGLEAMLALRGLAPEDVDVRLVSAEGHFFYRPLAVAEPFGLGQVRRWELGDLARQAGAGFSAGVLSAVDADSRRAHFESGAVEEYDALLIASGARAEEAVGGALTFRGPADADPFRVLLDAVEARGGGKLLFAVPSGPVWPLPIYELALLSASELRERDLDVRVGIVTAEPSPLAIFGKRASARVRSLVEDRGVEIWCSRYPAEFAQGRLTCVPEESFPAAAVVAGPRLTGPAIEGLPTDRGGFIPVDDHGQVRGLDAVYAAGDGTTFPIKQGGIAAAQADAAAVSIARLAGADIEPSPFKPVLRSLLLSAERPTFMYVELSGGSGETSEVSEEALWWPAGKIVGRYLSPFLATLGVSEVHQEADDDVLRVEIEHAALHELDWSH